MRGSALTRRTFPAGPGALAALCVACAAGCSVSPPRPASYARAYPEQAPRSRPLDIQVIQGDTTIRLTNTTARAFGASTLWLNSYYSAPIEGLAVGQTLKLPLSRFKNEHSESFRSGGFFATEPPERVVLAELETASADGAPVLFGLIVVARR